MPKPTRRKSGRPRPALKLVSGWPPKLTLVYGMRLFPPGDVSSLGSGRVTFTDGTEGRVALHVLDGTRRQIKEHLSASIDAFFDIYGADLG